MITTASRYLALALLIAGGIMLSGCEASDEPLQTDDVPDDARAVDAPDLLIPQAIDAEDTPLYGDDGLRFRDYSTVMHAVSLIASISEDDELAHEDFRPELGADIQRERGQFWLDMVSRMQNSFDDDGAWAPHLVETPDGWMAVGAPDLHDYAQGVYTYHAHHRADRWEEHGLEDEMTHSPAPFTTQPGVYLLDDHYADGRFYWDADQSEFDHESMANGVSGLHAHIYAWVRWEKPDGADDMGQLSKDRLETWLQHNPDDLAEIARELADTFDDAWDEDLNTYVFDGSEAVTYRTESVGALLRGKKALVDHLYMFGDDADQEHIDQLFTRSTTLFESMMELAEPWGLPGRVRFTDEGVDAETRTADVASTWNFVHHLAGGYSYTRERDGTAQLLTNEAPDLLDAYGEFVDTLLDGALEYQIQNGAVVSTLSYDTGDVVEDHRSTEAIGFFLLGAGNAYGAGERFGPPAAWDDDDVAARSRDLYTALADQTELLEEAFITPAE